jgi:diguanylate cyclase (GGDEF)-like protein
MQATAGLEIRETRSIRLLITDQLRPILEQGSVRAMVVAVLLAASFLGTLMPMPTGMDMGWMFIVPVAISAIAAGLAEGFVVAMIASLLCGAFASTLGEPEPTYIAGVIAGRLSLYGLTAVVLGLFAEAHHSVQSQFKDLAAKDPLTQLANVTSFYEELGRLEATKPESFALVLVDLDELKQLNDKHGHQSGSFAIQAVARSLRKVVRATDCVARFGGDEFVVILKDADRQGAQIVINRMREFLNGESVPGAPEVRLSVSAGISLYGEDGVASDALLMAADMAMYEDKRARKAALLVP